MSGGSSQCPGLMLVVNGVRRRREWGPNGSCHALRRIDDQGGVETQGPDRRITTIRAIIRATGVETATERVTRPEGQPDLLVEVARSREAAKTALRVFSPPPARSSCGWAGSSG